jgi:hypothetical protein
VPHDLLNKHISHSAELNVEHRKLQWEMKGMTCRLTQKCADLTTQKAAEIKIQNKYAYTLLDGNGPITVE